MERAYAPANAKNRADAQNAGASMNILRREYARSQCNTNVNAQQSAGRHDMGLVRPCQIVDFAHNGEIQNLTLSNTSGGTILLSSPFLMECTSVAN